MKDIFICRKCGFISTNRRAFVSVKIYNELLKECEYLHECGACYADEPTNNITKEAQDDQTRDR